MAENTFAAEAGNLLGASGIMEDELAGPRGEALRTRAAAISGAAGRGNDCGDDEKGRRHTAPAGPSCSGGVAFSGLSSATTQGCVRRQPMIEPLPGVLRPGERRQSGADWIAAVGAKAAFTEPGSPWENGSCESFDMKLRD